MAFRFIFWANDSHNNNLADSYTQQAEFDFRNTHQADFENLSMLSATPIKTFDTLNQNSSDSSGVKSAVVSELIQAVTENKQTQIVANDINNSVSSGSDTKEPETNLANALISETVKNDNTAPESRSDISEAINSVAETINSVSQGLDEQAILQNSSISTTDEASQSALKELLQKMKSFLEDLRKKVLSLLEEIQKPQLQYYYGVEDTFKDYEVKDKRNQQVQKQQEKFEAKIKQKTIDEEQRNQFKDTQIKLDKEFKVQVTKQAELDKMLARRMDEVRKREMFETNFLPK